MSTLQKVFTKACLALGIKFDLDYEIELSEGQTVRSVMRIRGFGGEKGMLIFRDTEDYWTHKDAIFQAGYGFSTLSEPTDDEVFDLNGYREVFRDWGWKGDGLA